MKSGESRQQVLIRERVNALIEEGLKHPFTMIMAATGYGKTHSINEYFSASKYKNVVLQLSSLDSLPSFFWNHLIRAIEIQCPDLAKSLSKLGFVDSVSKFDLFVKHVSKEIRKGESLVLVFDDFNKINNKSIYVFLEMLTELSLSGFHVILITNVLPATDKMIFMSAKPFLILTEDLKFNKEEIRELYRLNSIDLTEYQLNEIETNTEGWSFALNLLIQKYTKLDDKKVLTHRILDDEIKSIFEENLFYTYTKNQQELLIQLSLLDFFTRDFVNMLYKGDLEELDIFEDNLFIYKEYATDHIFFHQMYKLFLSNRKDTLTNKEIYQLYNQAAEYYESCGYLLQSSNYYYKCNNRLGMLECLFQYIKQYNDVPKQYKEQFIKFLDLFDNSEILEYPLAFHLKGLVYMYTFDFDNSIKIFNELIDKLENNKTLETKMILAEVYSAMGGISLMLFRKDFKDYYKKASELNPNGSFIHNSKQLSTKNYNSFFIYDSEENAKEEAESIVSEGIYYVQKFLHGSMSGKAELFKAEGDYFALNIEKSKQEAYIGIYKAEENNQYDIVCNGYFLLARIALMEGDYTQLKSYISTINEYAEMLDSSDINEIKDTALGWYYMKMHDDQKIPSNILDMRNKNDSVYNNPRCQIVYANHLLHIGQYSRMVGMLENPKGLLKYEMISTDSFGRYILLAIAYNLLGDDENALKLLHKLYLLTYKNKLNAIYIEADQHMLSLIDKIRKQDKYIFDNDWLNYIYERVKRFITDTAKVRKAYHNENRILSESALNPLTSREQAVLQAIANGLTREEIAINQYISINTVKSTLSHIYTKLDANNKGDAVSIALAHGYIEAYKKDKKY